MKVTRYENKIFSSNTYILLFEKEKEFWVIDIGDLDPVSNYSDKGFILKGVLITHAHYDHIYGLNSLIDLFPECVVFASELAINGLYSDKLNMSYYHEDSFIFNGLKIQTLRDNEKLLLSDQIFLEAIETPGHNEGCLTYKVENYLFTGDSYIPNIKVVTNLPSGNKEVNKRSLEKIKSYIFEDTIICPGHGEMRNEK